MKYKSLPALFQMEPIGLDGELEANGTIYRFCHNNGNDRCRIKFLNAHPDESLKRGVDPDAIDGTVCDQCGAVLVDDSSNAAQVGSEQTMSNQDTMSKN